MMRKIIEISSLEVDADDIIRKETYRFYAFNIISVSLDLNKTVLKQGDQRLSNHHLSNPTILYCLSYITPTCYLC